MALDVNPGALNFESALDTSGFEDGMKKIRDELQKGVNDVSIAGEKINKEFGDKLKSSFQDVSKTGKQSLSNLSEGIAGLINPTALITAGLTSAGIAIVKYTLEANEAAKAQKILNAINEQAALNYSKYAGKIDLLKDKLNDLSIPLKDRNEFAVEYNKIADKANQIDLVQLNNLDAINPKIEAQIKLFKERALARAAENVVAQKAEVLFKTQLDFDTKFPELNSKRIEQLQKNASDAIEAAAKKNGVKGKINVNELLNFADLPDSDLQKLAQQNERFKVLLDDRAKNILSSVNKQLQAIDQYRKGTKAGGGGASILQGMVNQAQKDLDQAISIASEFKSSEQSILEDKKVKAPKEDNTNQILSERENLLNRIVNLQRDASQSGLTKDESELDKIKEKYELVTKKLQDYNTKKDAFNNKNPNANIPGFTDADFEKLNNAKNIELANTTEKQGAAKYIQNISLKKEAFDKFEAYQEQHLRVKANDLYKNELDGFKSYLEFINSEINRITSLPQTVGTVNELKALEKARSQEIQSEGEKTRAKAIQNYKNLLDATKNYNSEKQVINKSYDELEKTLQQNQSLFTIEDYNTRFRALKQGREDDLKNLNDNLFYQTEAYRLMNTNILNLTKEGIKQTIAQLKNILKEGFTIDPVTGSKQLLTPEQIKAIQDAIDKFKELNKQLSTFAGLSQKDIQKIEDASQVAANSFHQLGEAISQANAELGDTLNTLGDITQVASDSFTAAADFASGNIVGGIESTVKAIVGIFNIGAKSRESEREAKAELKKYTDSVIKGQIDYNELLREQGRAQKDINELTNQELETRKQLLATQQQQAQADYNTLLNQIQVNGQQIIDEYTKKYGGFLGIGRKTKVVQDLAGISDTDFEALQKLSSEHKLNDATEEWFQALKKVHDELDSINESQQEEQQQIAERATATTSDAILDSILQGFEQGKKATADFADNFESLMRSSILNSFKYKSLQVPLQKFYEDFAAAAESNQVLSDSEIAQLEKQYNAIITDAGKKFDQLNKIVKENPSDSDNSLAGAIKGITENQANVLEGSINGMRLTLIEQLSVARNCFSVLSKIETNTARITETNSILKKFDTQGIKIR